MTFLKIGVETIFFIVSKKKNKDPASYSDYRRLRNKVQRDVRKAKANYFKDKVEEYKSDPKTLWHQLKSLNYSSKNKDQSNVFLNIDGKPCFNSSTVANYINTFYTTVASTLVKKLPPAFGKFDMDSEIIQDYYKQMRATPRATNKGFKLSPVSSDFDLKELCSLKSNKNTGLDEIPVRFLKDGATALKDQLTHIINLSITSNTVPEEFKSARVRSLFKKNCSLTLAIWLLQAC